MNKKTLIPVSHSAEQHVLNFFKQNLPGWAFYHNEVHTAETVEACSEIGVCSGLNEYELDLVLTAGWFHDTGYVFTVNGHEEKSCEIAADFLRLKDIDESSINAISKYIMATQTTRTPVTLPEFILRDADLISLGREDFLEKNNLLKKEIEQRENRKIFEEDWILRSIKFLNSHKYFTEYAKRKYGPGIIRNLHELKKQL